MSVSILILIFVFLASWNLWRNRKLYIYSWNTPGPLALPFVGNLYKFIGLDSYATLRELQNLLASFPDLMRIWLGPFLIYYVKKPEYIKIILNNAIERSHMYRLNQFPGDRGLLVSQGELWKRHRRVIMPAFNQKNLNSFMGTFNEKAEILCKQIERHVGEKGYEFNDPLSRCTLDIICETAMEIEMNTQTRHSDFSRSLVRVIELCFCRSLNVLYYINFFWRLSTLGKSWDEPYEICREFNLNVLKKKIREHNESKGTIVVDPDKKLSLMDSLMKMEDFTEEDLLHEVNSTIAAGSDTTSKTLVFTLISLGMHQDIQEKVFEEVMENIGPDCQVESHVIPKLEYTERVLKEVLRIFPTVPIAMRDIETDLRLDDKYILPEGSSAGIFLMPIHRNPEYWPDPLKFDPDRFLPDNVAKRNPYAYIPFLGGPRNCIGGRFAMMSMVTILVHMIRKYKFFTEYKTVEEIRLTPLISLKLDDGSKIWIERR